ncbi:MAG: hypothetical protein JJ900_13525 [Rhodospirillales bacterium]|nr:hypothetical protein [Rhodospirillales bacterium]MBO6787864.1 hypothetical protein [Rhodospirillales bacterium]
MALGIPSSQSVSFSISGSQTAQQLLSTSPVSLDPARARGLADGTTAGRFVERRVTIDTAAASQALRQSVFAGSTIRDALRELAGLAEIAANEGLVSESVNLLSADGTRVSRNNIQAQLDRAVALIDSLVSASATGSANFIDGSGPTIRIQTSSYGGAVSVTPQGFDAASLGLQNLDVSSAADARLTVARIENAINVTGSRLDRLSQLQSALGQTNSFDQSLIAATTNISGALPVGAFVNLSA